MTTEYLAAALLVFSGGYSAGYYAYLWSEKLDADTVEWSKENGGPSRKNGDRFRQQLLARGGSGDALQLFRNFRGRDAKVDALLVRRGLDGKRSARGSAPPFLFRKRRARKTCGIN